MVKRPIDAFVQYFLDVKPYHTKILEIVEQYKFFDDIAINIQENSFFYEQFINDPICDEVGFGLDFDDECGFSSPSCCSSFDCIGGFGLVYDNSDLLASAIVSSANETDGSITVIGDHRYDTYFQIKEVTANSVSVYGDARPLLDLGTHILFLVSPIKTVDILEVASNGLWISGNLTNSLEFTSEITIQRSQGNDGVYPVTGASYDVSTDRTFIAIQQDANLFQGSYNDNGNGILIFDSNTKNNGVYQRNGYVYQAPTINNPEVTIITLHDETPILLPDEINHGSVVFKTGMTQGRQIWLNDGSSDFSAMSETRIVETSYFLDTVTGDETTTLILEVASSPSSTAETSIDLSEVLINQAEDAIESSQADQQLPITTNFDLSSITTVELRGYFFGAGFDSVEECLPPIHSNVQTAFTEYLQINIISEEPELLYFLTVSEDFVPPPLESEAL